MEVGTSSVRVDCPSAAAEGIGAEIHRRLCSAGYRVLRRIESEYSDGVVVLRGRVPSYYMKQVAQSSLLTPPLVEQIVNLIEVADETS
jgi:hypothetical protein